MATVTIKNIDRLTQRFNKIANMELKDTMNKAVALVHGQAENLAPVDTGALAGSIHMEVKNKADSLEGRVYTNMQYAPYVEFGTGVKGNGTYPYNIKGLNLKYENKGWAYWSDKHEKYIYTTGQVAQPFMYPALKDNEKQIKALFKNGVKTKLQKSCKGGQ